MSLSPRPVCGPLVVLVHSMKWGPLEAGTSPQKVEDVARRRLQGREVGRASQRQSAPFSLAEAMLHFPCTRCAWWGGGRVFLVLSRKRGVGRRSVGRGRVLLEILDGGALSAEDLDSDGMGAQCPKVYWSQLLPSMPYYCRRVQGRRLLSCRLFVPYLTFALSLWHCHHA